MRSVVVGIFVFLVIVVLIIVVPQYMVTFIQAMVDAFDSLPTGMVE